MNARERKLALFLLGILVVAAGGFLFYQLYLSPLDEHEMAIADLTDRKAKKEQEILEVLKMKKQMDVWQKLSLPRDPKAENPVNFAWLEYEQFLTKLVRECRFSQDSIVIPQAPDARGSETRGAAAKNKQPVYTRLTYNISARATLSNLVAFLEKFHRTNLLHRVKRLFVQRPFTGGAEQEKDELKIDMTVEAIVLEGAENRKTLLPAGGVHKDILAKVSRNYDTVGDKNIFLGPADRATASEYVDVTRFVKLTDITYRDGVGWEGFLYNVADNRKIRVRKSVAFDTFKIIDDEGRTLVHGKVEKLDNRREIIFSADGRYYRMHIGQTLAEAMGEDHRNALSDKEIRELGLIPPQKTVSKD